MRKDGIVSIMGVKNNPLFDCCSATLFAPAPATYFISLFADFALSPRLFCSFSAKQDFHVWLDETFSYYKKKIF